MKFKTNSSKNKLQINQAILLTSVILSSPLKLPNCSPPEVFCKKGVVKNSTKLTGKHMCQSPPCNFIKKETQHRHILKFQ